MRSTWPAILLSVLGIGMLGILELEAANAPRPQRNVGDLKEQLEVGLRPRHPDDYAFIARVVTAVKNNELPLSTVRVTFNWARKRRPYPFPYFQRAVRLQAAKLGVTLR